MNTYKSLFSLYLLFFAMLLGGVLSVAQGAETEIDLKEFYREIDLPYSASNPPGPTFSEEEKASQLKRGKEMIDEIKKAYKQGRSEYVVAPGDYRFSAEYQANPHSFLLKEIKATADRPFRIVAYNTTFWFNLVPDPIPSLNRMVQFVNCSNVIFEGAKIDSDPRGCMEGKVVSLDYTNNRIEIEPLAGTRIIPESHKIEFESRILAFKATGHHIAALYQLDAGWGPGNFFYESVSAVENGRCWVKLKEKKLFQTLQSEKWKKQYGSEGLLEPGDLITLLYSTSNSILLDHCREMTIQNCDFYAAKACLNERFGEGGHRWINCRFMSRPGTNQLLGGDGTMNSGCRRGSFFDRFVVRRSTDDLFNNHGFQSIGTLPSKGTIAFKNALELPLEKGMKMEVYDLDQKRWCGSVDFLEKKGKLISYEGELEGNPQNVSVVFPDFQNAGWVIQNSLFIDCYQRVLLQCGPGVFQNNRIERAGARLSLENAPIGEIEGGIPNQVVITGNVFVDSGISPTLPAIRVQGQGRVLNQIRISNNLFCGSGTENLNVENVDGIEIQKNIFIDPHLGAPVLGKIPNSPPSFVFFKNTSHIQSGDNWGVLTRTISPDFQFLAGKGFDPSMSKNDKIVEDPKGEILSRIRKLAENHEISAPMIVEEIRSQISRLHANSNRLAPQKSGESK